jgi:hypothetical protein
MSFFRAALKEKVICVPGEFFDINPATAERSPLTLRKHVRFSFGTRVESRGGGDCGGFRRWCNVKLQKSVRGER